MVQSVINITESNNDIINIVKAKMKFKDKNETINFIIEEYGIDILEPEFKPEIADKIIENANDLVKNHRDEFVGIDDI
jgi:hypothetical protein